MKKQFAKNDLVKILEMNLFELKKFNLLNTESDSSLGLYAICLQAYLEADEKKMVELIGRFDSISEFKVIAKLRLLILKKEIEVDIIDEAWNVSKSESVLAGEAAVALGRYHLRHNELDLAIESFRIAYSKLSEIGCKKRSIRALQNLIISKTRKEPHQKYIGDYEMLAEEAAKVGDIAVEAISYHNISRELLFFHAAELALKYSIKAINLLSRDNGTLHYYEAVLNRCHVLIELQRYEQAYSDYQLALTSSHSQIKDACEAVKLLLENKNVTKRFEHIEPCWLDKLSFKLNKVKARPSKTEEKLINFIKGSPKSKVEIIDYMYGVDSDWESSQNKLRVLLHRFKKKFSDYLVVTNEEVSLVSELSFSA